MLRCAAVAAFSASGLGVVVRADGTPMRIVLLVDSSATMTSMLTNFRAALSAFVDAVPADSELALISTGGQLRIRVPPTSDREQMHKGIAMFASDGGGNSMLETLIESDRRLLRPAPDRKPVFVILTTDMPSRVEPDIDGYNRFMSDFVRRRGRAYGVVIRAGTALGTASEFVDNLTRNTGGTMEIVAVSNGLVNRLKLIAEALAFGR
jgi:Mg-chelatase subunit ChlD